MTLNWQYLTAFHEDSIFLGGWGVEWIISYMKWYYMVQAAEYIWTDPSTSSNAVTKFVLFFMEYFWKIFAWNFQLLSLNFPQWGKVPLSKYFPFHWAGIKMAPTETERELGIGKAVQGPRGMWCEKWSESRIVGEKLVVRWIVNNMAWPDLFFSLNVGTTAPENKLLPTSPTYIYSALVHL